MVIPTLNEAPGIGAVLDALQQHGPGIQVIVSDGGSTDGTRNIVRGFDEPLWIDAPTGRARQMNAGAARATGDILLFLHADTSLPADWTTQVRQSIALPHFAIGAFPFKLDAPGLSYRLIEWGVHWRCRWFRLPYGDQALFMKRKIFERCGGYAELPLMEDVDLVNKLRSQGRLVMARDAATTSARRWQQNGPLRQTWINVTTYRLYRLGVPPHKLARRYRKTREAIMVFCKYPTPGTVKTRLAATEGRAMATQIYRTLVNHTLDCARTCQGSHLTMVFFSPPDAAEAMPEWLGNNVVYRVQCEGHLGTRMADAFRQSLECGAPKAVIIGSDCPQLTPKHLQEAFAALESADLVLGPTHDGGYYLIGLRNPHPELFENIAWSTESVLMQTQQAARGLGLQVKLLESLHDLDHAADLAEARKQTSLDL